MEPLLSALILPETEPSIHDIAKLLFFFNSLSYYMPTEKTSDGEINKNPFKNLCTGYVPVPLHEDLKRFNRLLREMENSRPDDLARLFSSAQSPITTGQIRDSDEASAGNVISALQGDNAQKQEILHKERLWQARLVLKLAEMLNRREKEVRQGLARIYTDEQKVFASLEGLNESEPLSPEQSSHLAKLSQSKSKVAYPADYTSSDSSMLIPLRMKAWAELYLADISKERPFILTTTNSDNGSIILDRYENTFDILPQKMFSLSVPAFPEHESIVTAAQHYISSRSKIFIKAKESLNYLGNFLRETAVSPAAPLSANEDKNKLAEHVAEYEKSIRNEFPTTAAGNNEIIFYCFPGLPPEILLQKIFHLEPGTVYSERKYTTSILAIVQT